MNERYLQGALVIDPTRVSNPSKTDLAYAKLQYGRKLLESLEELKRIPPRANEKEFQWQCRALEERLDVYSKRLAAVNDPIPTDPQLERAEAAIDLSLRYFVDVLSSRSDAEDDT